MSESVENNPPQFPQGMNGGERPEGAGAASIRARWPWAEPSVWSERMLAALEEGVKGGRWYCLMDKVVKVGNLLSSFEKVRARQGAAGVDHVSVARFEARLGENLGRVAEQIAGGTYVPQDVRRKWIEKTGSRELRPLGIPTVRDRVVQGAVRHVLEPIFERDFAEQSYGFRPGRGCKDALRRVDALLHDGGVWVVDADIKGYFDSIPHERLMHLLRAKVSDGSVLALVASFLRQGVLDGLEHWTPAEGTPQGAVLSPLLANIYLDALDHRMAEAGFEMVRYADDFVVLCASEADACRALEAIRTWTAEAQLTLHPAKTRIVDARERGGFDFLGYHFERGLRWPRKKSLGKLRDAIREKTKRCNGGSLAVIIHDVNSVLRGWFAYFKHSHYPTFRPIDQWVRMRLRSILRRRQGKEGRGRGSDHQRWPNAYFAEQGLISLVAAHARCRQPATR
jgi:RNA-directed DNA polymerase